jgi:type IX secretion system substrate protein/reprolysin-like metallo-peptidase family M12B
MNRHRRNSNMITSQNIIRSVLIGFLITVGSQTLHANNLLNYLNSGTTLDSKQQHYLAAAMESPMHINFSLAHVNFDELNKNIIHLTLPNGLEYTFRKNIARSNLKNGKRKSWIGFVDETNWAAHFVWYDGYVDGHIAIDDLIYTLRDLSGNLFAIIEVDGSLDEGCSTGSAIEDNGERLPYDNNTPDLKNNTLKLSPNPVPLSTGECMVRVLVVYTPAVDAALTDALASIINQVNIANTGYDNSGTGFNIELASCYEISYVESSSSSTDLGRFRNPSDGYMDDVHTQRTLWSADQCVLIKTGGGGIAYLTNSSSYQFSVTGINNFSVYTFHHELGHNALLTHSLTQASSPGTAPYSGWGEPTVGCFRTIMAYSDACGTGGCQRQNIFSDDNGTWQCSGQNYAKGDVNSRNTDRLVLSRPALVAHRSVSSVAVFSDAYDWLDKESVHVAADMDLSYSSPTNQFELQSGADGSFRASNSITLGEGFWAHSGSEFIAYLDNCTSLRIPEITENNPVDTQLNITSWNIYPNPFKHTSLLSFETEEEVQVYVSFFDLSGRLVMQVLEGENYKQGVHNIEIINDRLSPGTYLCRISTNNFQDTQRVVIY